MINRPRAMNQGLYLTYVRNAKFINEQSLPAITFMGNCVVELYGLDVNSSFQVSLPLASMRQLPGSSLTRSVSEACVCVHSSASAPPEERNR